MEIERRRAKGEEWENKTRKKGTAKRKLKKKKKKIEKSRKLGHLRKKHK